MLEKRVWMYLSYSTVPEMGKCHFLSERMKLAFSTSVYPYGCFISDPGTIICMVNELDLALNLPPPTDTHACTHARTK